MQGAREFLAATEFVWHQRFELAPGVFTPGPSNTMALFDLGDLTDFAGKTVLDVGTSNGAAAFMAEQRGARRVVAVDIYPPGWFGFDKIKAFLGSAVEYAQGSVYRLTDIVDGPFDIVLFWGVLYHLRHPLLGTRSSASSARRQWDGRG